MVRTKVTSAKQKEGHWQVTLQNTATKTTQMVSSKMVINAAGPWVGDAMTNCLRINSGDQVRLVRSSHIVTKKLYDHEKSYFFQGSYGRIIFAILYETDFTLIGTTDVEHEGPDVVPECSDEKKTTLSRLQALTLKSRLPKTTLYGPILAYAHFTMTARTLYLLRRVIMFLKRILSKELLCLIFLAER